MVSLITICHAKTDVRLVAVGVSTVTPSASSSYLYLPPLPPTQPPYPAPALARIGLVHPGSALSEERNMDTDMEMDMETDQETDMATVSKRSGSPRSIHQRESLDEDTSHE